MCDGALVQGRDPTLQIPVSFNMCLKGMQKGLNENIKYPAQFPMPADTREERPFFLSTASFFILVFVLGQPGRATCQQMPACLRAEVGEGGVGVGWAGQSQAYELSQASCQLRFWDPGLSVALRQPGPKLLSRWHSVHGACSPLSITASPLRSLPNLPPLLALVCN